MANSIRQSELDRLKNSIKDMTDLSKSVRDTFDEINSVTGDTSDKFKTIVDDAKKNSNLSEKYLISQQLTKKIQTQINEFKSKSGYLDKSQLEFRKSELLLQKKIATAQISKLLNSKLDNGVKQKAIDAIKTKMRMESAELDVLEKQVDAQNDIVKGLEDQLTEAQKLGQISIKQDNLFDQGKNKLTDWYNKFKDINIVQKGIALGITAFVAIVKKGYENFLALDSAATKVRQTLGFFPGEMNGLRSNIKDVTFDLMDMGATFDDVAQTVTDISGEINGIVAQDKELLTDLTAISKNFGISAATSSKFLKTMGGVSGESALSQKAMIGFSKDLAKAAGVPLDTLMKDVAEAGDSARIFAGKTSLELVKSAAAARMLGTNLASAAASAEKMLDFESSINSELKASALLGQNINFNNARRMAFNKDTIGANKEILRITKQIRFNELNPIQMKAYADAAGKTVGELQDMLQQEKNMQLLRESGNQEQRDLIAQYDKLMQMKDKEAKDQGEIAAQQIRQRLNQERMAQLQNKFNQLISELAQPVMDIVEPMLDLAISILPAITSGIKFIAPLMIGLGTLKFFKVVPAFFKTFIDSMKKGAGLTKSLTLSFGQAGKSMGFLFKQLGFFSKLLGPIGLVIAGFQLLGSLTKNFKKYVGEDGLILGGIKAIGVSLYEVLLKPFVDIIDWIGSKFGIENLGSMIIAPLASIGSTIAEVITWPYRKAFEIIKGLWSTLGPTMLNSLKSVGSGLYQVTIAPFSLAWDWITGFFGGKSPSKLGLAILKGIKSVSGLILDALTLPFRLFWNNTVAKIPGVPELGAPSAMLGADGGSGEAETTVGGNDALIEAIQKGNQQVVGKIDELLTALSNGGIAVNLDGVKVNYALAKSNLERGQLGQATF